MAPTHRRPGQTLAPGLLGLRAGQLVGGRRVPAAGHRRARTGAVRRTPGGVSGAQGERAGSWRRLRDRPVRSFSAAARRASSRRSPSRARLRELRQAGPRVDRRPNRQPREPTEQRCSSSARRTWRTPLASCFTAPSSHCWRPRASTPRMRCCSSTDAVRSAHLDEYQTFAGLFDLSGEPGVVQRPRHGVELHLCWVADEPRAQLHAGEPEPVLMQALDWLRDTYREHRCSRSAMSKLPFSDA